MVRRIFVCAAIIAGWLSVSQSQAVTYTGSSEYAAGTGSNRATIAIDFDADNFFLFDFFWDGTAGSFDALEALDAAGDLVMDVSFFDFGSGPTPFINDFDYPGGVEFDYGTFANFPGWVFYTGVDNENWNFSLAGANDRLLSDGDYDSWVWSNFDAGFAPTREPGQTPVIPETASLALLGLGGLWLHRRWR